MVLRRWGSSIQKFGFINGVDNVNWPPWILKGRGLYLEGLIHGGAYFRNFTVYINETIKNGGYYSKNNRV